MAIVHRLDLTGRRTMLKECIKKNPPAKVLVGTDEFTVIWKYMYSQLIDLEKNDYFSRIGIIFEIHTNYTYTVVRTVHLSGGKVIKVYKITDKAFIKKNMEHFCEVYGLNCKIADGYGTQESDLIIEFQKGGGNTTK